MADQDSKHKLNKIGNLTEIVTWSVLLSKWTRFAQSAVALPDDDAGERWKNSVTPMIGLQAACFALGESSSLPVDERLLGIDRAGVIIREHARTLDEIWRGESMPETLLELLSDARSALQAAEHIAFHARPEHDEFVMPEVHDVCADAIESGFTGDLFAASPGTILGSGEPALISRPHPLPFDVPGLCADESPTLQQQIYRTVMDDDALVRDEVVPYHRSMPAGRPLLEHLVSSGELTRDARTDDRVRAWIEEQSRTMSGREREILYAADGDATEPE